MTRANPEVFILEDDAETLERLRDHFAARRFHPLAVRTSPRGLSALRNNLAFTRPVLAVIDWDLSKAPEGSTTSGDVLSLLSRELPDCLCIVYSANIDAYLVRSEIQRAHPRAWLHDKRDGDGSLLDRVDRLLEQSVGDLQVQAGSVVVHVPTRSEHRHREAVRLVLHHPDVVTFHSDTATKAVRRFSAWLREHGSVASVVSHGNRRYRLQA